MVENTNIAGIYGLFDAKTNECLYIGLSLNIYRRWKEHIKCLKYRSHRNLDFIEWFHLNNCDISCIRFVLLEEAEPDYDQLNVLEAKWFDMHSPKYFGKKPSHKNTIWTQSDTTREKISETLKKKSRESLYQMAEKIEELSKNPLFNYEEIISTLELPVSVRTLAKHLRENKIYYVSDKSVLTSYAFSIGLTRTEFNDFLYEEHHMRGFTLQTLGERYNVSKVTIYKSILNSSPGRSRSCESPD